VSFGTKVTDAETAFVMLDGPGVHEVRKVPGYDAEAQAAELEADMRAWRREIATQAGMAFGCEAYNEVMGN
jgi:hypothetical protein